MFRADYYIFTKTPTKDLERSFSQWADELRAIAETTDPVKQKVQLNAFVADRFEKNMAGKSQELADALKRFTLYSMQQSFDYPHLNPKLTTGGRLYT